MRKMNCDLKMNYTSETGALAKNNSFFCYGESGDFACWIGADVNPEADRQFAVIIAREILKSFKRQPTLSLTKMKRYINDASRFVVNGSENRTIRISLAITATDYANVLYIVTGNERIYHFWDRDQLATATGKVMVLGVDGQDDRDRSSDFSENDWPFGLFAAKTVKLDDDDVILICNSGLWQNVGLDEIEAVLKQAREPFLFLDGLQRVLAQKLEETFHNYTVAAIFMRRPYHKSLFDYLKSLIAVAGVISLVVGSTIFTACNPSDVSEVKDHRVTKKAPRQTETSMAVGATLEQDKVATYESNGDRLVKKGEYQKALGQYTMASDCLASETAAVQGRIQAKLEITKSIIKADHQAESGSFEAALAAYRKAEKAARQVENYDRAGLQDRVVQTQTKLTVNGFVAKGDREVARNNYQAAFDHYTRAQALAQTVRYDTSQLDLENKIAQVEAKLVADAVAQPRKERQLENDLKEETWQLERKKLEIVNEMQEQQGQ